MSRHERFIDFAKRVALTDTRIKKTYHAAVIVKGGKIISYGLNSHTQPKLFNTGMSVFTHAEIDAVQDLLNKNKKAQNKFRKHYRWYNCSHSEYFKGSGGLSKKRTYF